MTVMRVYVEGIGLWSPQLADFDALRSLLGGIEPTPPSPRPAAAVLPANERRRAPESVLLAVEVAGQAVAMSGRDARELPCVFASAHGDQPITDYMCATLAQAPGELSPTKFHNSVHNASVGYWTIATGCHQPSSAVAAQHASFSAGLLEAASQAVADQRAVLLVCSDTQSNGPLTEIIGCRQPFGSAWVLSPAATPNALACLELALDSQTATHTLSEPLVSWRAGNTSATALELLALLVHGSGQCRLDAGIHLGLRIDASRLDAAQQP